MRQLSLQRSQQHHHREDSAGMCGCVGSGQVTWRRRGGGEECVMVVVVVVDVMMAPCYLGGVEESRRKVKDEQRARTKFCAHRRNF